jgi:hypothetical protein
MDPPLPPLKTKKLNVGLLYQRKWQTPCNFELHTKHIFVKNIELNTFLYAKNHGI